MARVIAIDGADDVRLGDYVRLRDVELRKSLEAEHGLFIAEGAKVIRRALRAGYPARSFLVTRRWLRSLADVLDETSAPVYLVADDVAERVTGFHVHRGALASMGRLPLPSVAEVSAHASRLVVCEDIVDHTNLGAIVRCAAALGIHGALLAPRCADPLYRRAIKVSMGAVFSLPYARLGSWHDGLAELRARGFRLLALTPSEDAAPIHVAAPAADDRCALLLGTEGDGLSSRWLHEADLAVRIPLTRGVDSLNVASAAAVACYLLGPSGT
ncbi:MAG: TrmH family RNA methyltransferase [Streptosporangiaceae bacterium]